MSRKNVKKKTDAVSLGKSLITSQGVSCYELSKMSTRTLPQKWVRQGKQRYKCKECHYQWIEKTHRGRPLAERALAVFLYCHGLSMNAIAKILGASPSTILSWIRHFGTQHTHQNPKQTLSCLNLMRYGTI